MNNNQRIFQQNRDILPYTVLQNLINEKNFCNVGIITKVIDENFVNVKLYHPNIDETDIVIGNVRLLHIGTNKCRVIVQPAIGDNVLLFACKELIEILEYDHQAVLGGVATLPYSNSTIQGILVSPESDEDVLSLARIDEKGNISAETTGELTVTTVKEIQDKTSSEDGQEKGGGQEEDEENILERVHIGLDKIEIIDNVNLNKITLDENGTKAEYVTDKNNEVLNYLQMTKDGIEVSDCNNGDDAPNVIRMTSEGIQLTDKNKNSVVMNGDGIEVVDLNDNAITLSNDGVEVKDKNDNSVVMDSSGIKATDKNNNVVEMSASGIKTTDKNNNVIEMSASGTKITDKNNNTLEMAANGITQTTVGTMKAGSSSLTIGGCFEKLIDEITKLQTAGSPAAHSVSPTSVTTLNLLKAQIKGVFL